MLTSEVVTNAIVYGGSEIDVVLERRETGIRVEVADASPRLPARRPLDADMPGGRGLRLLDSLAGGWGVIELATGKVVWFEIETHPKDPGTSPNGRVPPQLYL